MITTDCSLQVFGSVLSRRWHVGEDLKHLCLEHLLQARHLDQCGSRRHLHELFLVNGILGLWRQRRTSLMESLFSGVKGT